MVKNIGVLMYKLLQFPSKCFKFFNTLENQIKINLLQTNVETRPAKSNGIGCVTLIPTVLIIYTCSTDVSPLYKMTSLLSVGLLCYSILFNLFLSTSCAVLKEPIYGGCISSGLMSTILVYVFLRQGFVFSVCISMLSTHFFSTLLRICLMKFQRTFTVGEAIIVGQAITLFTIMSLTKFFFEMTHNDPDTEFISTIVYIVLYTVTVMSFVLWMLPDSRRNPVSLGYIVLSGATFVLLLLHHIFGPFCIITLINFIFIQNNRWSLILLWLFLVACAVVALLVRTRLAVKADTVTRKSFHLLASLVFLSGVVVDVPLMTLAAGIGLGLLIFIEAVRKSGIEPISSALQAAFLIYSDEKDCGVFAMTPLYLFAGLACPLLLVPTSDRLERLSGVLSTGVGDAAASWFGSRYGFYKWPQSSRTLEGSAFNVISQLATVYMLQLFELLDSRHALLRTAVAATASAWVEAHTDQVDNLVLPLVTIIAYQTTAFVT